MVKVLVLKAPGTNCDQETVNALKLAGAQADLCFFFELFQKPKLLLNYSMLVFPGGFSYGDYLGSGKVWSLILEASLQDVLKLFVDRGGLVLGICNGFQVLVKLGLLPGWEAKGKPTVSLTYNKTNRFECRWLPLQLEKNSVLFKRITHHASRITSSFELPIAHGEGRFVVANKKVLKELCNRAQVFLRYRNNINGSMDSIAGITNKKGNVIGMMPHPERFATPWQHYNWQAQKNLVPWGLEFLKSLMTLAN